MTRADRGQGHAGPLGGTGRPGGKQARLRWVPVRRLIFLRRNPQYLSAHESAALEASIRRDGFLAPILCRSHPAGYELLSGNHRAMAARNIGLKRVPALVVGLTDAQAARVAVNLNTVHGQPPAALLAPFLAGLDSAGLATVHLPDALRRAVFTLDQTMAAALGRGQPPAPWDRPSPQTPLPRRRRPQAASLN